MFLVSGPLYCHSQVSEECKLREGQWDTLEDMVNRVGRISGNCKRCNAHYTKEWSKNNPGRSLAVRRSRKQKTKSGVTDHQWRKIKEMCENRCCKCGKPECTMDHVVSISTGGPHSPENIQPLCRSCNSSKGSKSIDYRPLSLRDLVW